MNPNPKLGDSVKVCLEGESPWVTCLGMSPRGTMFGKIDNHLVATDLHGYEFGDVVEFEIHVHELRICWWQPIGKRAPVAPVQVTA